MTYFNAATVEAAKLHAREVFPQESCGLVVDGAYMPCDNLAGDPLQDFEIDPRLFATYKGRVTGVIHSHPDGPMFPSQRDMESQLRTNKVWGIIPLNQDTTGDIVLWGADLPIEPIIGRNFMHGVTDCYSLLRDMFRSGSTELAGQGIPAWPFPPIALPDFARKDNWWVGEDDFYEIEPPKLGFKVIEQWQARPGDVFLMRVRSSKFNHAGMLVGDGMIVHHLPSRLSRREPGGLWGRQAERWIRYEGPVHA